MKYYATIYVGKNLFSTEREESLLRELKRLRTLLYKENSNLNINTPENNTFIFQRYFEFINSRKDQVIDVVNISLDYDECVDAVYYSIIGDVEQQLNDYLIINKEDGYNYYYNYPELNFKDKDVGYEYEYFTDAPRNLKQLYELIKKNNSIDFTMSSVSDTDYGHYEIVQGEIIIDPFDAKKNICIMPSKVKN